MGNKPIFFKCFGYKFIFREKKYVAPLAQSLAGNVMDFFKTYSPRNHQRNLKNYDDIRKNDSLKSICDLFNNWQAVYHEVLLKEIKKLVDRLEKPISEFDLRCTVTGITSVSLRNEDLIELFTKNDIIPILLILCEKCEGSSLRCLLLRALSTMCCTTLAVRQFEKFSGIQIISDTLLEKSRPEPERSEAVALLAQVTAPWIEDNHSIKGLHDYCRNLIRSLTKFLGETKCCQNLLLCTAALANLSAMDQKSVKYMLHNNTVDVLLESVTKRGPYVSVYLMEQVATLLANMASCEGARRQLVQLNAVEALLSFLKINHSSENEAEKRLQQKAIIALSRMCTEAEASHQLVQLGGVDKLVGMCREKDQRYDSDAVLVAALVSSSDFYLKNFIKIYFQATLRKIADTCGRGVINSEDAQELVEPKLLDSFLAYSTQSESYV